MTFLVKCYDEGDWDAAQQVLLSQGITWIGKERGKKIRFPLAKTFPTIRIVNEGGENFDPQVFLRYGSYSFYKDEYPEHTLLTLHDLETLCVP